MAIKVMVVDDSALVRRFLTEVLNSDSDIEVLNTAMNPVFALEKLAKGPLPDIITLDVEMPEMDGVTFLKKLSSLYDIPVIMFSSVTESGAEITLNALKNGAFDFVTKPKGNLSSSLEELKQQLIPKIKEAYTYKQRKEAKKKSYYSSPSLTPKGKPRVGKKPQFPSSPPISSFKQASKIVVVGSSTGGTNALENLIPYMPSNFPPVLVVQHMPPKFTQNFAQRLNQISQVKVKEAEDGDKVVAGTVYIAPGDFHMELKTKTSLIIHQGERVNRHRPSADPLFESAARFWGKDVVGVILTGMGNDGALGMQTLKRAGAYNIAQDEESSVVFGMPKEAIKLGVVDSVLPLSEIFQHLALLFR